jgi:hypothetical protein
MWFLRFRVGMGQLNISRGFTARQNISLKGCENDECEDEEMDVFVNGHRNDRQCSGC